MARVECTPISREALGAIALGATVATLTYLIARKYFTTAWQQTSSAAAVGLLTGALTYKLLSHRRHQCPLDARAAATYSTTPGDLAAIQITVDGKILEIQAGFDELPPGLVYQGSDGPKIDYEVLKQLRTITEDDQRPMIRAGGFPLWATKADFAAFCAALKLPEETANVQLNWMGDTAQLTAYDSLDKTLVECTMENTQVQTVEATLLEKPAVARRIARIADDLRRMYPMNPKAILVNGTRIPAGSDLDDGPPANADFIASHAGPNSSRVTRQLREGLSVQICIGDGEMMNISHAHANALLALIGQTGHDPSSLTTIEFARAGDQSWEVTLCSHNQKPVTTVTDRDIQPTY